MAPESQNFTKRLKTVFAPGTRRAWFFSPAGIFGGRKNRSEARRQAGGLTSEAVYKPGVARPGARIKKTNNWRCNFLNRAVTKLPAFRILLFFTLPLLLSFDTRKQDIIIWNASRPLIWDDFRGKPEKRFAAASTHYDILQNIRSLNPNEAQIKIEAVFFCRRSWKRKEWINESVLMHEQKHFDIVELYARRMRKDLALLKCSSMAVLNETADSLYKLYDKEMDRYQDQYDEETDGSMNGDKQREWNRKIPDELHLLELYSQTTFTLKIPG